MQLVIAIVFMLAAGTAQAAERLTVKELQALVLNENPKIRSMELEAAMMQQRISQSTALDDPKLKLGLNNVPTNGFSLKDEDMTSKEIGLSQMFPLGGKLALRERVAQREYARSIEKLRKEKIELLAMLRMNVYELGYVRQSLAVFDEVREQVKLVIESQTAANRAGMGSLANVIKANMELGMIDEEVISLRQREREFLKKIAWLAGRDVDVTTAELPEPVATPVESEIVAKIAARNPDIAIISLDHQIATAERDLKQKEYVPDLELGVSYMQRDAGPMGSRPDMISAMAQFNIPLWYRTKNLPMVEEMRKKQNMTESLRTDKYNELAARAATLIGQMEKWEQLYRLYTDQLLPQARLTFDAMLARYATSEVEFMPVLDTVRVMLRYKKEALMAKKEYAVMRSDLDALTGAEATE